MITTVTLNAAIDRTLLVPNFQIGRRHRASEWVTQPGGKGVNVARTLKLLNYAVVATGFAGGPNGAAIVEGLTHEGILNDFIRIEQPSRTSSAVIDPGSRSHTEINEYGPRISANEIDLLLEKLRYLSRVSTMVVLAGSLPRDVDPGLYKRLIDELHRHEVTTVLDTSGEPLRLALAANPGLISPNQREAEAMVGHEFSDQSDFVGALDELARMGARDVIITCAQGCYARIRDGRSVAYFSAQVETPDLVSTIGSGDAFLAGYAAAAFDGLEISERLQLAVGAGAANTQILGAGRVRPEDVKRYRESTTVTQIEGVLA